MPHIETPQDLGPSPSRRKSALPGWALVLMLVACVCQVTPVAAQSSRWGQTYLPNVELVTQDGEKVRFYDDVIKGKIVLISFIYTSCLDICPLITARLADAYERLGEAAGRDYVFVSISIDPARDTPERLKRHADAFRSDKRWVFLTGKPEDVLVVRRKLGERSRKITEHGSQVLLYNDRTGEWLKDSVFSDLAVLSLAVQNMDPAWRSQNAKVGSTDHKLDTSFEQPGQALFTKACAACHSVGKGAKIGPDLIGVRKRRSTDWLVRFIKNPPKMHADGDPVALELAAQYPNVRMPALQMSDTDVADLLAYLDARSYAAVSGDMAGPHGHGKSKATKSDASPAGHSGHRH
ncbi:MAG: SCO family protein [Hyphomicrobiaceae bacterium]|nr:SCO family protein [Hyphomicrobiaceae bacterium]